MHQGAFARANEGEEAAAGWWPTSPSSRWAGRPTPASSPRTTRSICPATVSPQDGGTAPAPAAWGWRAKHPWPGSKPCSRAATPRPGSCWAVPTAATPSPPSMWSCAPTKSVSILYGLGDAATGRAVLAAHHAGLAEAAGYLDGHLGARRGHGGVQQRPPDRPDPQGPHDRDHRDGAGDGAVHPDRGRAPHRLATRAHPPGPVGVRADRH